MSWKLSNREWFPGAEGDSGALRPAQSECSKKVAKLSAQLDSYFQYFELQALLVCIFIGRMIISDKTLEDFSIVLINPPRKYGETIISLFVFAVEISCVFKQSPRPTLVSRFVIIAINCEIFIQDDWSIQADGPRLHSLLEQPFALAHEGCPIRRAKGRHDGCIYAVIPAD